MKFEKLIFDTYEEMGSYLKNRFNDGKGMKKRDTFYAYHDNSGSCDRYYLYSNPSMMRWDHEWKFVAEDPKDDIAYRRYERNRVVTDWQYPHWMWPHTWTTEKFS